jgi:hypothetical protein
MAEFVKKGTKGAVGTLTKAEGMVASASGPIDLTILKAAIPDEIGALTEQIKESHKIALGQMGRAIVAAGRAGQLLLAAKTQLPKDKAFTEWLAETFEFSQRTAYDYMKVAAKMATHAAEIEQCSSIRDVLKLCDTEDAEKKKKKDPKRETVVIHLAKTERWIADEKEKSPVEDWDATRRETVKKLFEGVARFHAEL